MGHWGFSYIGCIWLLMLILPNLAWTRCKPQGYSAEGESRVLLAMERSGEVCVSLFSVCFSDYNLRPFSPWFFWLAGSFLLMLMYEVWWIRYFCSGRTLADFYGSFWGIPVAGASLPVLAFLLLAIYGRVLWLGLSAILLGIGHIGIHLRHRRSLSS